MAVWFVVMYSVLWCAGSMLFLVIGGWYPKNAKVWPAFLIMGSIIAASSLLGIMLKGWLCEIRDKAEEKTE